MGHKWEMFEEKKEVNTSVNASLAAANSSNDTPDDCPFISLKLRARRQLAKRNNGQPACTQKQRFEATSCVFFLFFFCLFWFFFCNFLLFFVLVRR